MKEIEAITKVKARIEAAWTRNETCSANDVVLLIAHIDTQAAEIERLRAVIEVDRALLEQALDALTCSGDNDDPGHRCSHCDDYVDRNSVVRQALRAALAAPQPAPAWRDAPTVPGLWVCHQAITDRITAYEVTDEMAFNRNLGLKGRWFGPIPPDGDTK